SGDINQDGIVDLQDLNSVYSANINGVTGYNSTDITGDMFTEIGDLSKVFINKNLVIKRKRPLDFSLKGSK
ncbi:MAG: hypothetical protein Q8M94_08440, partial [Ignavibacteria bacterium]|nr:hypothetical protein [Ignavibacteria bacterium]